MIDAPNAAPDFLDLPDGRRLAYHRTDAKGAAPTGSPGVVFFGGFRSDMTGSKAVHIEAWAQARGRAALRLDYTGHGASSGAFEEGCIGDWARDAVDATAALTEGPLIVVGSSMGGWIGLIVAQRLAAAGRSIAAFVGLAAAPDFTEDLMWARFSEDDRARILADGRIEIANPYAPEDPTPITRRLIEDGREHLVLRAPLTIDAPVRLLQGTNDDDVPPDVAIRLLGHVDSPDARLTLIKGADHRLSEPRELEILTETLDAL